MATECQDCEDETKRRTRCKNCGQLVCGWCLHHIHHLPPSATPPTGAKGGDDGK